MSISVVVRWRLEVYYAQFFFRHQYPLPHSGAAWGVLLAALCSLRLSKWLREPIVPIFILAWCFSFPRGNSFFLRWNWYGSTSPPPLLPKIIIFQDDIEEEPLQQRGMQRWPPPPHALDGTILPTPHGERLGLSFPQPLMQQEPTGCRPWLSGRWGHPPPQQNDDEDDLPSFWNQPGP
jgi:hypothetical protein